MKRILVAMSVLALACTESSESPLSPDTPSFSQNSSGVARVRNGSDAGQGSFRRAVQDAIADPTIHTIEFEDQVHTVHLKSPVVYTGSQALEIKGNQAALDGRHISAGAAFTSNSGSDLKVSALTIENAPAEGLIVALPDDASGTVKVSLIGVTLQNNGSHGALINDQAEYFIDPNSTSSAGSAASLDVTVIGSKFLDNGFTALDQDGLRINEGGGGNLRALISASRVEGNGGDGIELDERDTGDIQANLVGVAMNRNGGFDAADFDDGIDLDEGGAGSILGSFLLTSANQNFEQGYDINENDAGDIRLDMTLAEAIGNAEEGIEYEEDDDFAGGGDIVATLTGIKSRGNGAADGDAGVKLREKGEGNLDVRVLGVDASDNLIGGLLLREDAGGSLTGHVQNATTTGNGGNGIEFDENSGGDLTGVIDTATSSNNTGAGVRADQASPGVGTLQSIAVTTAGNAGGNVVTNGVTITP